MAEQQPPNPQQSDDDAWVDALSGHSAPSLSAEERNEIEHLRKAWMTRRARLEAQLPEVDEKFFEQLIDRRSREIVERLQPAHSGHKSRKEIQPAGDVLPKRLVSPMVTAANRPTFVWGLVASLLLVTAVGVQMGIFYGAGSDPSDDVIRGQNETVLLVNDPSGRAAQLAESLRTAGASPKLQNLNDGRVLLRVQATPGVLNVLSEQRILPQPKDGQIVLVLEKPVTSNDPLK